MARYTDDFRASACLMLEAAGYPDRKGALMEVSSRLSVPHGTLSRWARKKQNPPPSQLEHEKAIDLESIILREIDAILGEMPNARQDADYKELGTVLGILLDKLIALSYGPTSTDRLTVIFERAGVSTLPEHLARLPDGGAQIIEAVQRPSVRPALGQNGDGH